jgi:hypothetical protein
MTVNYKGKEDDNKEVRGIRKRFPTLMVGCVMLVATVALLGGKTFLSNVMAKSGGATQTASQSPVQDNAGDTTQSVASQGNSEENAETIQVQSEVKDGVQYITSSADAYSYESIIVRQGIPVKWTINIPEGALNNCNNAIIIPKYQQEIELKTGENIIEFTPEESGVFPFTCWMGMIQSDITVVAEDGTVDENADDGTSGYTGSRGMMSGGCGMENGQGAMGSCCQGF